LQSIAAALGVIRTPKPGPRQTAIEQRVVDLLAAEIADVEESDAP
jgi:hypothetical protein